MPALIGAAKAATVAGFNSANAVTYGDNAIAGEKLFDTAMDGNSTLSESMNALKDGLNMRIYRIDQARIVSRTQGLYPIEEIIPVCFCPTFRLAKDMRVGDESIDDFRENLRLASIAIYSQKNFPNVNNTYRRTPPQETAIVPLSAANYLLDFESRVTLNDADGWYSCPFTILYSVVVKNFI
jgi:hypothetical protein